MVIIKFVIATGRLEDRGNEGDEESEEEVSSADEECHGSTADLSHAELEFYMMSGST